MVTHFSHLGCDLGFRVMSLMRSPGMRSTKPQKGCLPLVRGLHAADACFLAAGRWHAAAVTCTHHQPPPASSAAVIHHGFADAYRAGMLCVRAAQCVRQLRPRRLIPTVNAETPDRSRALVDLFADLLDLSGDRCGLGGGHGAVW